jgi:hypothetical protein
MWTEAEHLIGATDCRAGQASRIEFTARASTASPITF